MVQNGDFSLDWSDESSHTCKVFPAAGEPYETEVGNIFTPPHWTFWFRHVEGEYAQPEARDAWTGGEPNRARSGPKSFMWFTFDRRHDAGLYQSVNVTPGSKLSLRAWFHAWSNHEDASNPGAFPHPDNPKWSEGAGESAAAWQEGTQPHDTGDSQQDAKANFTFWVGIDPFGGTDPYADTVVWSTGWHIYNIFQKVELSQVVAQAGKVTVFLRSRTLWPFKHSDAYVDDVALTVDEPEPSVSFIKKVHLVPQDATSDELAQVLAVAIPNKEDFTWSVDSAFATNPNLTRQVTVWEVQRITGTAKALARYVVDHYPPWPGPIKWRRFQSKNIWDRDISGELAINPGPYTHPTLEAQGGWWQRTLAQIDGVTIHHTLSNSPHATAENYVQKGGGRPSIPYTLWITQTGEVLKCLDFTEGNWHDHVGNENRHLSVGLAGSLHLHAPPKAQLDAAAKVSAWVIESSALPGVTDIEQIKGHRDYVATTCPGWEANASGNWKDDFYAKLRELLDLPDPPPPPDPAPKPAGDFLSIHVQNSVPDWLDFLHAQPRWIKLVGGFERAEEIKQISPNTKVLIRFHTGTEPPDIDWAAIDRNIDFIDAVEDQNETIATGDVAGIERAVNHAVAFSNEVKGRYGDAIKACLLNTAVGNPGHNEVYLLLPVFDAAVRNGHYVAYHPYFPCAPGYAEQWMETEALHHHMRDLLSWYPVAAANGLHPKFLATEGGAIGAYVRPDGKPGAYVSAASGFRALECLNGDWNLYLKLLLRWREMREQWNATHGWRSEGGMMFTVGGPGWANFELKDHLNELADALV